MARRPNQRFGRRGLSAVHDLAAILGAILDGYKLPVDGFHGVVHWARVLENGLRISEANGADREIVTLFALFHDSRRVNEDHDDGHGLRGGELARSLRGKLVHLDDDRFDLLYEENGVEENGVSSFFHRWKYELTPFSLYLKELPRA
jgi:uncharacterized protein